MTDPAGKLSQNTPEVTVIFPLYQAADKVEAILASLLEQRHPSQARQEEWLRAIFIDNASTDGTATTLRQALSRAGNPRHVEVVENPQNIGLARSLNRAFGLAKTKYVLTCHSDCR